MVGFRSGMECRMRNVTTLNELLPISFFNEGGGHQVKETEWHVNKPYTHLLIHISYPYALRHSWDR